MSNKTKSFITTLAILVILSACAKDMKQSDKLTIQGCTVGGFGAGALAFIKYSGQKDAKEKIAISSMLGCIAGTVVGYHIGKRTEHYTNAQQAADEEIAFNRNSTKELKKYNQQLATNISDYEQQISMIRDSKESAADKKKNLQETKSIIAKQRNKAQTALADVEAELLAAQNQYAQYKDSTPPETSTDWRQELAALQQEKEILSSHVSTLNAMDASI
ncbi:MAG: hypothetical protein KDJ38_03270 [Gammaproteobacteria bacterium]|nr:hypothetical protein [Gammaproteobacteria bacterium]